MNNYNTSKDYELLWELAKTQNIISIVDEHPYIIKVKNEVGEDFKDTFINKCKSTGLEFIIPNAWISVKDRLPEEGKYVLTCTSAGEVIINYIISGNYWFDFKMAIEKVKKKVK